MVHYITSPGQGQKGAQGLSELGKKQARLLAAHLASLDFHGRVLTASTPCALETAESIAEATGAQITHFPALDAAPEEDAQARKARIVRGYRTVPLEYPQADLLFLTDAASAEALIDIFTTARKLNTAQYDCALTTLMPLKYFTPILFDTSFLRYEDTTLGEQSREACDVAFMRSDFRKEITLPDFSGFTGERILHIGDTESATYPFYRRLFELVRPDVILHTGDIADEVKIGRHPEFLHEYTVKITEMLEAMRRTGARLIVVLGNHDVAEAVRAVAPYAEVYEPGVELVLSGVPCRLGHQVKEMVFDRKYISRRRTRLVFSLPPETDHRQKG